MSRSHSIVGLNDKARDFVDNLKFVGDYSNVLCAFSGVEIHSLRVWYEEKRDCFYKEVVQLEPWASGPWTYTCLEDIETGKRYYKWNEEKVMSEL